MESSSDRLLGLAESVSDGSSVDWHVAESQAVDERERSVVRELRRVADVAIAYREGEAEPLPIPSQWGSLDVLERLGAGGFGDVYRSWDAALRREVALKILRVRDPAPAGTSSLLLEEGRLLAQVRHPNVVTVHGTDKVDGRVGIWMELVRGRTLARLLREEGPLAAGEAAAIGIDLCKGLAAIHAAGLVHGDVKAQNVMREPGGRVVLMDPGVGFVGTPPYLAPELMAGARPTPRSDVYAVGVLLHHLVSGAFPTIPLREARPDLPHTFAVAVERAIAPDPAMRPASARDLEAELRGALGSPAVRNGASGWRFLGALATFVLALTTVARFLPRWSGRTLGAGPTRVAVQPPALGPGQAEADRLDTFAGMRAALGHFEEADRYYERVQKIYENAFGPDHVEVAVRLRQRAFALRAMGSRGKAKELYERALSIFENRLGPDDDLAKATLAELAAVYKELGDAEAPGSYALDARTKGDRFPVDPFLAPLKFSPGLTDQVRRRLALDGPYTIEATPEWQGAGRLALRIRTSRPVYVYAVAEHESGRCSLVFPIPGQEQANPMPGPERRIPGRQGWTRAVLGRALVVFVDPNYQMREFELAVAAERVPRGARLEDVPLSPSTRRLLSEAGGMDVYSRLYELARPLPQRLEMAQGLWIRGMDLGPAAEDRR